MTPQFVPNTGQLQASQDFIQFLFSDAKEFRISGAGGVGKTALMEHFINTVIPEYHNTCKMLNIDPEFRDVAMTATTNKAAEELSKATKMPCGTVHSFLGLTVKEDYATGKQNLTRGRNWRMVTNTIIFLDEASMADTQLKRELEHSTMNCKIVYVGDHCQLKPVGESISPVYAIGAPTSYLTEQMRNNGQPALMALCAQLRRTTETGVFEPIQIVPGVIDLADDAMLEREIRAMFSTQNTTDRVLAFSNSRVLQYNDHIRTLRGLPDRFTVGELLVNNSAIQLAKGMISVEAEVTITKVSQGTKQDLIEQGRDGQPDVYLEVEIVDIHTNYGDFSEVRIPVNRDHFRALCSHYKKLKRWDIYYQGLTKKYPDFRQRDAATVHKAQGSTYGTVIVDTGDISRCNIPDMVARMLYVAASRPRNRIIFTGNLAQKYGGFLI